MITGYVTDLLAWLRPEPAGDRYRCPECGRILTARDNSTEGESRNVDRVWTCPNRDTGKHAFAVQCNSDIWLTRELGEEISDEFE